MESEVSPAIEQELVRRLGALELAIWLFLKSHGESARARLIREKINPAFSRTKPAVSLPKINAACQRLWAFDHVALVDGEDGVVRYRVIKWVPKCAA